jgi:hypothetical protein
MVSNIDFKLLKKPRFVAILSVPLAWLLYLTPTNYYLQNRRFSKTFTGFSV